jgi:formate dehydrogenase
MAVNADEGEPGTFKDRYHLERDPHRFLEGMLIAAWAVDAEAIYIYLRDEYPAVNEILQEAINDLEREGLNGDRAIHLRRGAGAYICGEESAMLESIEGKRGLPRHKPPYPSQVGLFGRPTLVHNVETLYWVRDILERGPNWFSGEGRNGRNGRRSFSVSGRVREPGVKFAPAGITAQELIDEYCGGMADGHSWRTYRSISTRWKSTVASSVLPRSSCCQIRTASGKPRSILCDFSRTRAAASARRAVSGPRKP